jgi:hypothetical protein
MWYFVAQGTFRDKNGIWHIIGGGGGIKEGRGVLYQFLIHPEGKKMLMLVTIMNKCNFSLD